MAAETVRLTGSSLYSLCSFNGSPRGANSSSRPIRFLGLPPRASFSPSSISSSLSHFLGSMRFGSQSSKVYTSRQQQQRRNFSVFAMAADGLFLYLFQFCLLATSITDIFYFDIVELF